MASRLILRQNIYLIGDVDIQILGNKLSSKLQVLKVFFYHLRILKTKIRESATKTINEVKVFWKKVQLPIQRDDHCIEKLLKLYNDYQYLQKNKSKKFNEAREQEFVSTLKNLFDIASANVEKLVDANKYNFLVNQREDGRVGYIADVESEYDEMQRKAL